MDPKTVQFVAFAAFSIAAFGAGYTARVRGWVHEDFSRRLHLFTLVGPWSLVILLSLWQSPPGPQAAWLVVIEPVLVVVPALLMVPLARRLGFDRKQAAVLAISAGLCNAGFTLGGFIAYTAITDPSLVPPWIDAAGMTDAARSRAASNAALSYAIAQVTVMSVFAVVVMYPLALRMGGDGDAESGGAGGSLRKLMWDSFVDVRAAQLYAAVIGALLGWFGPELPEAVGDLRLLDVLMFLGAGGAYAGIGLRLHIGHSLRQVRAHALLAAFRFALVPLITAAIILALRAIGQPQSPLGERVLLINAFMATAIQSVMIANLFHLDTRLASGLWVVNTVLCLAVPLPVILIVFA